MIIITGGAGFIGYNLLLELEEMGYSIVVVDDNHNRIDKSKHKNVQWITISDSYLWLGFNSRDIKYIFHLGAITDTMERDWNIFEKYNLNYSKFIWNFCSDEKIPLIYASSAAVYGTGDLGFNDDFEDIELYDTLNDYADSKLFFDNWIRFEEKKPPFWAGLRFFNVYGQHEEHKGRMASVMYHFYNQIKETGKVKLFKNHNNPFEDGNQRRDFIYVDDVVNVMIWFLMGDRTSGIYNVGTAQAMSFNDVARIIFKILGKEENIEYIDMPENLKDSYQDYTCAEMNKLINEGFSLPLHEIGTGIGQYIKYLENENR